MEGSIGEHGERLHFSRYIISETKFVHKVENNLSVLVGVRIAGEDARHQG
jgi:hypothetical protein